MNSKILVLGNGFLGSTYKRLESHFGEVVVYGRDKFDVDTDDVFKSVKQLDISDFDVVINCIGNADTRYCEDGGNWQEVLAINGELPKHLSDHCYNEGKQFVHISSGCVYDKNNEPQSETHPTVSHCKYVVSKLVGEYGCNGQYDLILRPRLYFGGVADKGNLLTKMMAFDKFLTELNSFTSVETVVHATARLLGNDCKGVFNIAERGYTNMSEIAKFLFGDDRWSRVISAEDLCSSQCLVLVNNIMDINKLEQYYQPPSIWDSLAVYKEKLYN